VREIMPTTLISFIQERERSWLLHSVRDDAYYNDEQCGFASVHFPDVRLREREREREREKGR